MTTLDNLLDRFNSAASLFNALALVRHCHRNPGVLAQLSEDQAGAVRNAERMAALDMQAAGAGPVRLT